MTVYNLLFKASVDGIVDIISKLSGCTDIADLKRRTQEVISELKQNENFPVISDTDFCFIAVRNGGLLPYVTLVQLSQFKKNNFELKKTTEYSWFWGQTLGISIDQKSLEESGPDVILAGILYHLMYFDLKEDELAPIRRELETECLNKKISVAEFYRELLHKHCAKRRMNSKESYFYERNNYGKHKTGNL